MLGAIKAMFKRGETVADPVPEIPERARTTVLDTTPKIRERFPGVKHLAINLTIRAPFQEMEPTLNNRSLGPDSVAFFHFRCKNPDCKQGGFDLTKDLEQAIAQRQQSAAGRQVCQGFRTGNNMNHQACHFELNYKVNISYD